MCPMRLVRNSVAETRRAGCTSRNFRSSVQPGGAPFLTGMGAQKHPVARLCTELQDPCLLCGSGRNLRQAANLEEVPCTGECRTPPCHDRKDAGIVFLSPASSAAQSLLSSGASVPDELLVGGRRKAADGQAEVGPSIGLVCRLVTTESG